MKVIAKTNTGYLVEATADELAQAAGYRHFAAAVHRAPGFIYNDYHVSQIPIGTVVHVDKAQSYLEALHSQEKKCRDSAAFLRGMADMLDAALPTTIIPPPEPEDENGT